MVILSAASAGMVGAFASKILEGSVLVDGVIQFSGPGEPLGAFLASLAAIALGHLVSGKTSLDILVTPFAEFWLDLLWTLGGASHLRVHGLIWEASLNGELSRLRF